MSALKDIRCGYGNDSMALFKHVQSPETGSRVVKFVDFVTVLLMPGLPYQKLHAN